jgi:hypothetical protein
MTYSMLDSDKEEKIKQRSTGGILLESYGRANL